MANDSEPAQEKSSKDLVKLLIDQKIISSAQAQLAQADQEVTGMTFEEVLLARRWIDEATLEKVAPWITKAKNTRSKSNTDIVPGDDYQANLKIYRQLMEEILGTSWD